MSDITDNDHRLYVHLPESWTAHAKLNSTKEYCYRKSPGDDHFHLLMKGEIYLIHQGEKYCLNCALEQEAVSMNRMHWQRS